MRKTYYFGVDVAIVTAQFQGDFIRPVVSSHPYVGIDSSARRVKREVLNPRGGRVRHELWCQRNRKVEKILSLNRDTLLGYTQKVGGRAAYLGWYSRHILVSGHDPHRYWWSRRV
jgi:hypothetical protein